jgi:ubiquinone biosynthesis protein UbiJ
VRLRRKTEQAKIILRDGPPMIQTAIAHSVGCSVRTVARASSELGRVSQRCEVASFREQLRTLRAELDDLQQRLASVEGSDTFRERLAALASGGD